MKEQRALVIVSFFILVMLSLTGARRVTLAGKSTQRGPDAVGSPSAQRTPEKVTLRFSSTLPIVSQKEQLERRKRVDYIESGPKMSVPTTGTPIVGPKGPGVSIVASHDFKIWRNTALSPPGENKDNNEPSVANNGKYVFYTGNKYAARSTDAGATWRYVDPYADFPGFCCDQDVIYDKSRDLFFWFRITRPDPANQSQFRIGVSKDRGASFYFWNWRPTDFDASWTDIGWDYPQLAMSDNYLYFTINAYRPSGGKYISILARASLDKLHASGSLSWTFWKQATPSFGCFSAASETKASPLWTPVHGAKDAMYIGQTTSNDCFTIWRQRESNTTLEQYRSSVPAWTATSSINCPLPNGDDPCLSTSNKVSAGWTAKNTVGFFWSVAAGNGFPRAYVNAASFDDGNLSYKERPYIWSNDYAWAFAAAYPNKRGDLAIASWKMGGGVYPQLYVGIDDEFNGNPAPWEIKLVGSSTSGPGGNNWGHYLRVRPYAPDGLAWIVSGFISKTGVSEPRFAIFGRERDEGSINH